MMWLYDIPTWLLGLLCVAGFVGFALAGLFVTHRQVYARLPSRSSLIDNGVVGWFSSSILVLYGITLGLIAVATWQGSTEGSSLATHEAAAIAMLYRDLGGYPQPLQGELREQLRAYTRFIIEDVWPAQRRGEILDGGTEMLNAFQDDLFAYEPATTGQQVIHAEAVADFDHMIDLRRQRIDAVGSGVPSVLWAVVLLGGGMAIAFSFVFQVSSFRLHALLTGGLAAVIGLLVFLIVSLDRPYRGHVSVSPAAYQLVLERLMESDAAP